MSSTPSQVPEIKIPLRIIKPEGDVPGKILAYKKGAFGEVALVLGAESCVLLHHFEGVPRVATGTAWSVPNLIDDGLPLTPEAAVGKLLAAKNKPPSDSPATYRGAWSGSLILRPKGKHLNAEVVLVRRIATYAQIGLTGTAGGWGWRVERAGRWFTNQKSETSGMLIEDLADLNPFGEALSSALGTALGLVREACGVRDTRRQGAYDPVYAEKHPGKPRKPVTDPTLKLGVGLAVAPKAARQGRRKAAFRVMDALVQRGQIRNMLAARDLIFQEGGKPVAKVMGWEVSAFADDSALAIGNDGIRIVKASKAKWKQLDSEGKAMKNGLVLDPAKDHGWVRFNQDQQLGRVAEIKTSPAVNKVLRPLLKQLGTAIDRGEGHVLLRLKESWGDYAPGSLAFSEGPGKGVYLHQPVQGLELVDFGMRRSKNSALHDMEDLLGKVSDQEIANMASCDVKEVKALRRKLKIEPHYSDAPAPKAPKAPKAPPAPKAPKAPPAPKAPKAPPAPKAPAPPVAAPAPQAGDAERDKAMMSSVRDMLRAELGL